MPALLARRRAPGGRELALGRADARSRRRHGCGLGSLKRLPPSSARRSRRKEKGFDVYDGISIMGEQIKMSATDSSAGCQAVCRNTPGCFAATYNDFFRGKNVACIVYREITDVMKAPTSTLMVRNE